MIRTPSDNFNLMWSVGLSVCQIWWLVVLCYGAAAQETNRHCSFSKRYVSTTTIRRRQLRQDSYSLRPTLYDYSCDPVYQNINID